MTPEKKTGSTDKREKHEEFAWKKKGAYQPKKPEKPPKIKPIQKVKESKEKPPED